MSDITATTARLFSAIQSAVPAIMNISVGTIGVAASVLVFPSNQQAAAQATINAFDWSQGAQDAYDNLQNRTVAKADVASSTDAPAKVHRAVASVLIDELNILRLWITDFKAAVAAATSLADLKTRVAAITPASLPARTLAQAKTAIAAAIDSGTVD